MAIPSIIARPIFNMLVPDRPPQIPNPTDTAKSSEPARGGANGF